MKNQHGFTLTEVLLAVMIVGVIGVALAAITTAAQRESGVGRTRMILRNQLSVALRQLRQDIHLATKVEVETDGSLKLTYDRTENSGSTVPITLPASAKYAFTAGELPAPGGGTDTSLGGKIYRIEQDAAGNETARNVWLDNVKKIASGTFASPSFKWLPGGNTELDSRVRVQIIVQNYGLPVVNEAIDEIFVAPNGFRANEPCLSVTGDCSI